jgi:hypothetical protein
MSRDEYRKQRKYAESFPRLDTDALEKQLADLDGDDLFNELDFDSEICDERKDSTSDSERAE